MALFLEDVRTRLPGHVIHTGGLGDRYCVCVPLVVTGIPLNCFLLHEQGAVAHS